MQMKHKQVKSNLNDKNCKQLINILAVDDDAMCQFVLEDVVKNFDNNAKVVGSGKEAIEEVMKGDRDYHLVIADLNMPGMDGYEVAARLRAYAIENNKRICIFAQTASNKELVEEKCIKAGFDGVMIKPVSIDCIRSIIEENFK